MTTTSMIDTRQEIVSINGREMLVSIISYQPMPLQEFADAFMKQDQMQKLLAEEFLSHPLSETQHSACVIQDTDHVKQFLTAEMMQSWFEEAPSTSVLTQKLLNDLFRRPVFQIVILNGVSSEILTSKYMEMNPEANRPYYVSNTIEALELAKKLLRIAHRL